MYTYNFTHNFGDPIPDPSNPHQVDNGGSSASILYMPDWPESPYLDEPNEESRGTLDGFPFRSEILDNTREIKVWRPRGYGSNDQQRYPLLVVNHGDNLLRGGLFQNTLENLVGESVEPLVAVFIPRSSGAEYGGERADDYNRFLLEEMLPHLERHYRIDPERRAILGPGSAGVAAVYAATKHPEVFSRAAVQSYYPIEPAHSRLDDLFRGTDPKPALIYVVWSRHDYDLGNGVLAAESSQELIQTLEENDFTLVEQVADYSPGWAGWRGQHDDILRALFPVTEGTHHEDR